VAEYHLIIEVKRRDEFETSLPFSLQLLPPYLHRLMLLLRFINGQMFKRAVIAQSVQRWAMG
jgi:uncharacterized membrane protein (GlpM family)